MSDPLGIKKAAKKAIAPVTDPIGKEVKAIQQKTAKRPAPEGADKTPLKTMREDGTIPEDKRSKTSSAEKIKNGLKKFMP